MCVVGDGGGGAGAGTGDGECVCVWGGEVGMEGRLKP